MTVALIPIADLSIPTPSLRAPREMEYVDTLVAAIKTNGFVGRPAVYFDPASGKYNIVRGRGVHRLEALKRIGYTTALLVPEGLDAQAKFPVFIVDLIDRPSAEDDARADLVLATTQSTELMMSTADPNEPDDKDLLLDALRGFVDQYDNDRRTWPDDMVALLDRAHYAIAAVTGLPRVDYDPTVKKR